MNRTLCILLLLSLGILAGCNEKEVKTVQWYTEHPEERTAQIKLCADNPGKLENNPNCINARQAYLQDSGGDPRDFIK